MDPQGGWDEARATHVPNGEARGVARRVSGLLQFCLGNELDALRAWWCEHNATINCGKWKAMLALGRNGFDGNLRL